MRRARFTRPVKEHPWLGLSRREEGGEGERCPGWEGWGWSWRVRRKE